MARALLGVSSVRGRLDEEVSVKSTTSIGLEFLKNSFIEVISSSFVVMTHPVLQVWLST